MQERQIKSYFKQQVHALLARSATEPNGFRAYFENREPRDEEILGLLAVSTVLSGEFPQRVGFPTALEALAALSRSGRAEICREFRKQLKDSPKQLTHA
jgi:hypothetical protein